MSGEMKGDRLIGNGIVLEFRKFKDGLALYKKNTNFSNETENNISKRKLTAIFDAFINAPQTFITTVGLYNDSNELLATAKLSKPLKKDFTKEALIRVKLDF